MDSDESEGKDWSDLEAEAQRGKLSHILMLHLFHRNQRLFIYFNYSAAIFLSEKFSTIPRDEWLFGAQKNPYFPFS